LVIYKDCTEMDSQQNTKTVSIYILEVGLMAIVITDKGLQGTCVQLSTS
jgi:hypothetical protein